MSDAHPMDDLIWWLRGQAKRSKPFIERDRCEEAADSIATLTRERDNAVQAEARIREQLATVTAAWSASEARAQAAEAALEVAERALEPFAGCPKHGKRGGPFVIANASYEDMCKNGSAPREAYWHWPDFKRASTAVAHIRKLKETAA